MCKLEHHQGSFSSLLSVCLLCFVYFLWVAPSIAESVSPATANPQTSKSLIVSTNDGLVSVKATQAPLRDIIEHIGHALGIDVEAQVGNNEKVTEEFQDLTLDQAMERLSGNYAYTADSDGAKISKLFIYPKGVAAPSGRSVTEANGNEAGYPKSRPEPFKFEFDPNQYIHQER